LLPRREDSQMRVAALICLLLMTTCLAEEPIPREEQKAVDRSKALLDSCGTYNGEPRDKRGRVDIERLIAELKDIRANTYNWLVWHAETDWEDLRLFLPLARENGILVWVTLVPPTESPPRTKLYSEPFRLDFERWGEEIARLSVRHPNLVAWSIDDFTHNLKVLNPERMRKICDKIRKINPKLAFAPCSYYSRITAAFIRDYKGLIDGILFPYRHESAGANLKDASLVVKEVKKIKGLAGASVPVIVDVYATKHSSLGKTTPAYVKEVMVSARQCADGVHVYCHQNKKNAPEKYGIIREIFREWAGKKEQSTKRK
jgi:hypothetical protein